MWKLRKDVPFRILRKYGFKYNKSIKLWEKELEDTKKICITKNREVFEIFQDDIGFWFRFKSDKKCFYKESLKYLIKDNLLEWENNE